MRIFRPTARLTASLLAVAAVLAGLVVVTAPGPGAAAVARRVLCVLTGEHRLDELEAELREVLAAYDPEPVRVADCRHAADVGVDAHLDRSTRTPDGELPRPRAWSREIREVFLAHGWVDEGVLRSADGRLEVSWSVSVHSHRRSPDESESLDVRIFYTGRTHIGPPD